MDQVSTTWWRVRPFPDRHRITIGTQANLWTLWVGLAFQKSLGLGEKKWRWLHQHASQLGHLEFVLRDPGGTDRVLPLAGRARQPEGELLVRGLGQLPQPTQAVPLGLGAAWANEVARSDHGPRLKPQRRCHLLRHQHLRAKWQSEHQALHKPNP